LSEVSLGDSKGISHIYLEDPWFNIKKGRKEKEKDEDTEPARLKLICIHGDKHGL
jgi:hypothetical protein